MKYIFQIAFLLIAVYAKSATFPNYYVTNANPALSPDALILVTNIANSIGGGGGWISNEVRTIAVNNWTTNTTEHLMIPVVVGRFEITPIASCVINLDTNSDGVVDFSQTLVTDNTEDNGLYDKQLSLAVPPGGRIQFDDQSTTFTLIGDALISYYGVGGSGGSGTNSFSVEEVVAIMATNNSATATSANTASNLWGIFNVLDYGAMTNRPCGSNIQAAIDAACVKGGVVYIPAGYWDLGNHLPKTNFHAEMFPSSLTIWSNNVTLRGAGQGKTVVTYANNLMTGGNRNMVATPASNYVGGAWVRWNTTNITLEDITFDANNLGIADGLYDTTQFYNCWGEPGIVFRRCDFLRNGDDDGIDTQNGGPLLVEDCYSAFNGGDGLGVQNTRTTIINSVFEYNKQEGLELYDLEVYLSGVIVRHNDVNVSVNSYKFVASGCTFVGTNTTDHSIIIGDANSCHSIQFLYCLYEDVAAASAWSTIHVNANDSVEVIGGDVRSGGKAFLSATNADVIRVTQLGMGSDFWVYSGMNIRVNGGNEVTIDENRFRDSELHIVGTKRIKVIDNTFRITSIINNATNAIVNGNTYYVGATLAMTNANMCNVAGNVNGTANFGTLVSNNFAGNSWLAAPAGVNYYNNSVVADSITNRFFLWGTAAITISTNLIVSGTITGNGSGITNINYAAFQLQYAAGATVPTFPSGVWTNINFTTNTFGGASFDSAGAFTLSNSFIIVNAAGAGKWKAKGDALFYNNTDNSGACQISLYRYNNTPGEISYGGSTYQIGFTGATANLSGVVDLVAGDIIAMRAYATGTANTQVGRSISAGIPFAAASLTLERQ